MTSSDTPTVCLPVKNVCKVIGDCTYLIQNTANPKIYFSKYVLLTEILKAKTAAGDSFSKEQLRIMEQTAESSHEQFLERAYCKLLLDVERLKTKICRMKHFQIFMQDVMPYYDLLTPKNRASLAEINKDFQRRTYRW